MKKLHLITQDLAGEIAVPRSTKVPLLPTLASPIYARSATLSRCVHRSIVDIRDDCSCRASRRSYASRSADIAAPHLLIMPHLHFDALHAAARILRIALAHAHRTNCAAAESVQHCLQRHSLRFVCAAGAPRGNVYCHVNR